MITLERSGRVMLTVFVVIAAGIFTALYLSLRNDASSEAVQLDGTSAGQVVRDSSHRLNSVPDSEVTFVEFLDFECEACRAMYPNVEQLRAEYGDRVNFVARYFPLPSHYNGERAARAVEAAAQQGQFEQMYSKMFETQGDWGERQVPADDVFRGFASELGLNVAAFGAAYNDPATLERVRVDVADGRALGVQGTPAFFLNGEPIQPRSYDDMKVAVESALSG